MRLHLEAIVVSLPADYLGSINVAPSNLEVVLWLIAWIKTTGVCFIIRTTCAELEAWSYDFIKFYDRLNQIKLMGLSMGPKGVEML